MFSARTQTGAHLLGVAVCFLCGFVMIMIAIVTFYFCLVCEQLEEAEEDGLSGAESGDTVTFLHISF